MATASLVKWDRSADVTLHDASYGGMLRRLKRIKECIVAGALDATIETGTVSDEEAERIVSAADGS